MGKLFLVVMMALTITSNVIRAQVAIESIKFGTGVEKNDVVGESTSFSAENDKVYCWLRITGAQGKTVMVKWYRDNVFLSDVALEITSNNMRTYAYKTIFGNGGNYKVEIVDDGGNIMQTGEFVVSGGSVSAASATEGGLIIEDLKFGTGVEKSEIVGEATTFSAATDKVYCWVKVTGGDGKSITLKWYYNNTFMNDVLLEIKSNSMRTYAYKTIAGNQGDWRVEIVGSSGAVLQAASFIVK
ncbi:DUF2914 domain-containing protein [bacterium]|nr:DUF2914 domain-containing protein [bacterium]